jgi:16S rRNA G1207 methylase RsmC
VENNVTNAQVMQGDIFSAIQERFNTILLNPPQSAGKDICFRMIEESHEYLDNNGFLQLVARHNKGGRQLEKKMQEIFGNVKQIAKKGGYRVYVSQKIDQI